MVEPSLPVTHAVPDLIMRRLINLMARLDVACKEDANELARLRNQRQIDIVTAERSMRTRTEQAIGSSYELVSTKSLGGRLRAELSAYVSIVHLD